MVLDGFSCWVSVETFIVEFRQMTGGNGQGAGCGMLPSSGQVGQATFSGQVAGIALLIGSGQVAQVSSGQVGAGAVPVE